MANKLQALIFDVDGTLSNTEADGHRVAFNQAFDEYKLGWHWDIDTYGKLLAVTGGKERMKYYANDFLPDQNVPNHFDTLIPQLHQAKTRYYTELLATGAIPLRHGVERLLNEAREHGLRLAIATTTTPANVTALLVHTLGEASIDWFEVIAAGDIVAAKKPAADIYHYALTQMQLSPEQCLAFEDSENGLRSALGASLKTIVTTNSYTREHNFDGACIVLDDLGEPDQPFTVSHGDAYSYNFVNINMLEALHKQ